MYILIGYRLCRRPLGPEAWMLGCLDARMPVKSAFWQPRGSGISDLKAKGDGLCDLGATFGHPWATFGHPWGPFSYLVHTLGRGLGALGPLVGESLEKGTQKERNGNPK